MDFVERPCQTLLAPLELQQALEKVGENRQFRSGDVLFRAGDADKGVFLIRKGKVCLEMPGMPQFDRVFPPGSLLGLPAMFTGNPYRLTAASMGNSEVVQVSREKFLALMDARSDLCEEATKLLSQALAFSFSASGKYPSKIEKQRPAEGQDNETQRFERPAPSHGFADRPIICPVCLDHAIEKVEGIELSASNVGGKKVGGASLYRCSHWHLFALFKQL
jgi:CRP-like cAMP-binding protein